jgi:hypothetical protein
VPADLKQRLHPPSSSSRRISIPYDTQLARYEGTTSAITFIISCRHGPSCSHSRRRTSTRDAGASSRPNQCRPWGPFSSQPCKGERCCRYRCKPHYRGPLRCCRPASAGSRSYPQGAEVHLSSDQRLRTLCRSRRHSGVDQDDTSESESSEGGSNGGGSFCSWSCHGGGSSYLGCSQQDGGQRCSR